MYTNDVKKVNPVHRNKEAAHVVVVGGSKKTKRDDSKFYAFDSDNDEDEPVSSRESNVKASTTEDIVPKSALNPDQVPDDLEQAYVYHRTLIALHLLHFSKKFPSALKVYSAEKNVKWKKKGKKSTNPDEFPSRFFINLFKKLININASFI